MSEIVTLSSRSVPDLIAWGIASIEQAGSFEQVREIAATADALKAYQRSIGSAQDALDAATEIKLRAERRMGSELAGVVRPGGDRRPLSSTTTMVPKLDEIGVTRDQSSRYQKLAEIPQPVFEETVEALKERGDLSGASVKRVADIVGDVAEEAPEAQRTAVREALSFANPAEALDWAKQHRTEKAAARRAELSVVASRDVVVPDGRHGVIVVDPPWPMQKIERDVRPNQVEFDYPTMTEDELIAFGERVQATTSDDCHLFMWTTHRFLPMALRLIEAWDFRYVLTMVWHKTGGFQPIGLPQYNCEFAVYARRGSPRFIDTKAFPCCFEAPRREHSRKPDEFYDVIRRVTDGPRIDIFSREAREGFSQLGNEADKFAGAA